jgi:hypothetical protein
MQEPIRAYPLNRGNILDHMIKVAELLDEFYDQEDNHSIWIEIPEHLKHLIKKGE